MDDCCGRGAGDDGNGVKSHCWVKLAAKRESFMLEGRFTGDAEEAKVGDQMFEIVARISIPPFL